MDLVVNVTENWAIGKGGDQLVYISADLKRFRQLTTGKTVVLGRKTLATFPGGRPLKNRTNLVLSGSVAQIDGAEVYPDLDSLLQRLKQEDSHNISIIGGASVYEALLPYCHKAYVTKTYGDFEADTFFPNLDEMEHWEIVHIDEIQEEEGIRFQYVDYINHSPKSF